MRPASKVAQSEREIPLSSAPRGHVSALWVSWNDHRRTTGLCAAWDVPVHIVRSNRRGLGQWVGRSISTLGLLQRTRPQILFVQNPSLALTVLATLTRRVFGYYLVVDAHNEGVRPYARPGRVVRWVTRRLLRSADATIVTNDALAKDVHDAGGRALVLPDSLPEPDLPGRPASKDEENLVVIISSFMSDEPVAAIVSAAAMLPDLQFAFTGDARRLRRHDLELPPNVRLTGYLTERAFWKLLSRAAVVCDLTLKPDCLVCGAYEALALGKPMVLSDNPATREIFGPAAILTSGEADDIARAVRTAIEQRDRLEVHARRLRQEYGTPWHAHAANAWDAIRAGATAARRGLV